MNFTKEDLQKMLLTKASPDRLIIEMLNLEHDGTAAVSYLRQQVELKDNESTYTFNFSGKTESKTERYLSEKDLFVTSRFGIYLMRENPKTAGSGQLISYPDKNIFKPVAQDTTKVFDPAGLESIYNGHTSIQVGQNIVYDAIDNRRFRQVPVTQSGFMGNGSETANSFGSGDGLFQIDPYLILNGKERNEIKVHVPTYSNMLIENPAGDGSEKMYLVCVAYGASVPGGATK